MPDLGLDLAQALDPTADALDPSGRSSPAALAVLASRGRYQVAPHLELLNKRIVDVAAGRIPRLMVIMPPRHGKSELVSNYTPAWFLGTYPDRRVMLASYEADFAASWGRKARDVLAEFGPSVFGVRLREDASAASRFDIKGHRGGLVAVGAGGAITGRGADLFIIDDPIKGAEDAASKTSRDSLWSWWQGVAHPRLEPSAGVVLVMTRWHEDDLAGRLLQAMAEGGERWEVLRLPALAEEDDPLDRPAGAALWPERYPVEALDEIRRAVGSVWWSAQYQGRPSPLEGSVFKREHFRYWQPVAGGGYQVGDRVLAADSLRRFVTADLAISMKTTADFTVISTWATTDRKELLLLDVVRGHYEGPDQVPLLRRVYDRWHPSFIGVESVAFQAAIVQEARRDGLPITELKPDRDKVSRALVAAARMEGGGVFFSSGAPWLPDIEEESLSFPHGKHDDFVDCLSYASLLIGEQTDEVPAGLAAAMNDMGRESPWDFGTSLPGGLGSSWESPHGW